MRGGNRQTIGLWGEDRAADPARRGTRRWYVSDTTEGFAASTWSSSSMSTEMCTPPSANTGASRKS